MADAAADHVRGLLLPGGRHRGRDAVRCQPRRLPRRARPPRRRRQRE
uniref:Uncharacterized protein n=1 Tax=Arundo donax TaxID=35708 RepID=A0A0A9CEC5_ARUDO